MKKKRFTEEQIVRILRAAETTTIEAAVRQDGSPSSLSIGGSANLDKWTWTMCGSCGTYGRRMPG